MDEVLKALAEAERHLGEMFNLVEQEAVLAEHRPLLDKLKGMIAESTKGQKELMAELAAHDAKEAAADKAWAETQAAAAAAEKLPPVPTFVPFARGQALDDAKMQKVIQSLLKLVDPPGKSTMKQASKASKFSSDFWKEWDDEDFWKKDAGSKS